MSDSGAAGPQTGAVGLRRGKDGALPDSPFGAWKVAGLPGGDHVVADLPTLAQVTGRDLDRLPYSIRVLLENGLRHCGRGVVQEKDVHALLDWDAAATRRPEFAFMPGRVLLQDFTGVPCVVDLAALRSAVARAGGDPKIIDPSVRVDLVIDHSVQVDCCATAEACRINMDLEMERNEERYSLLRWAQGEFHNLTVIPPGTGICHQVNLEFLADVVRSTTGGGTVLGSGPVTTTEMIPWAYPDTVIGTDSHTTMINGLGVLGWGVGGIEAEGVMLGEPYFMLVPQVVGVRLIGELAPQATATDLVLTATELLRGVGVVGCFVEYFGPGAEGLSLPDRATVANMAPEYGATCGFFPVDAETVRYLRQTGRSPETCSRTESYCRSQRLWREPGSADPEYSWVVELDLSQVTPSLAGPRRPQDRVPLQELKGGFRRSLPTLAKGRTESIKAKVEVEGKREALSDGHVVIASITSCTNTSNPGLMLAAGLLARNAVALGLAPARWVRTSLAPGSRAVTGYLAAAGLLRPLEELGFCDVGYGCATCIGNSGPLADDISRAIVEDELVVAAVLSGNRNFEARIHPLVRANYLASPPMVVAFALAGTVDIDLTTEPLGVRADGRPVFLEDIWPAADEVAALVETALQPEVFTEEYRTALKGSEAWRLMPVPTGALYQWQHDSTYVQEPHFFAAFTLEPKPVSDVHGARILGVFGDSVTTDHISPAGAIGEDGPAGRYLYNHGVAPCDFNTYGSRRGNHEVLMRGAFANVRLRNGLAGDHEGGWTTHQPSGELMSIYDAAMRYQQEAVPLVIFAGKEYGTGSSRDWAAKGTALLGVRAVIARSFERIHRSNLVGMGVLPLELNPELTIGDLELDGTEQVDIEGLSVGLAPGARVLVRIRRKSGKEVFVPCVARLDSSVDVEYFEQGGLLPRVLRSKLAAC
ncbi:MAG: aconitate hydratase AcnA [Thermoleophilia bacterium]|jgi:aconitate hydratase